MPTRSPTSDDMTLRPTAVATILLASMVLSSTASAQSILSEETWELSSGKAIWGIGLPGYQAGNVAGSDLGGFRSDGDSPGFLWDGTLIRRFAGYRTQFELNGFWGTAGINSSASDDDITFFNNAGTLNQVLTGGGGHLDHDVAAYGFDIGLRDTWRFPIGGLSAGLKYSTFAIDQDFDLEFGGSRILEEELDTDFNGGKGFVGWEGTALGYVSRLDLSYGYYDVDAEFSSNNRLFGDRTALDFKDQTGITELSATVYFPSNFGLMSVGAGVKYIEDMPGIDKTNGVTTIDTDDAALYRLMATFYY